MSQLKYELVQLKEDVKALKQIRSDIAQSTSIQWPSLATLAQANSDNNVVADNVISNMPSSAAIASSRKSTGMAVSKITTTKKSARLPVVGCSTTASKLKSVVTRRPVDIFVSRLHPDTEPSDLLNCVKDVLGEDSGDIKCNKLTVKYPQLYASYHISVSTDVRVLKRVIELLNAADSWPEGVLVRRYFSQNHG